MVKCKRCRKIFSEYSPLRQHTSRVHKIRSQDFYVEWYLKGKYPTCKCGCGERTSWAYNGFNKWIRGHISRVHNNWGNNPAAVEASRKTRKKMWENGELEPWNKGLTAETDERVAANCIGLQEYSKSDRARKIKSNTMKRQWKTGNLKSLFGADTSQWQGGTSDISAIIYADNRLYREWKYPILKNGEFKCMKCNEPGNLHVHHNKELMADIIKKFMTDIRTFADKKVIADAVIDYHIRNKVSGEVLCGECYSEHHPSLNF